VCDVPMPALKTSVHGHVRPATLVAYDTQPVAASLVLNVIAALDEVTVGTCTLVTLGGVVSGASGPIDDPTRRR
jgi:hypothetical protein